MSNILMTAYVLVWPLMAAGVMVLLCVALARDIRAARASGDAMV